MALTGLDIYKLLPKTNCRDCGFSTCLAFAMALAQKKTSLDKCPHVSGQAKEALDSASQPPIKLVVIGSGDSRIEIGNETVMYRHEQKFYHPAAIGFAIEDIHDGQFIDNRLSEIASLRFERVGQTLSANLVCIMNSSKDKDKFIGAVKKAMAFPGINIALSGKIKEPVLEAARLTKDRRPLIVCEDGGNLDEFIMIAKELGLALAFSSSNLDEAAINTEKARQAGINELVLSIKGKSLSGRIQQFTYARRAALKKNMRSLGYPVMVSTESSSQDMELAEAVSYVMKYAGIVILRDAKKESLLPLLVARQDLYQDPQKPVQVEPRIYEIGKVSKDSPVLVTTNFSITYFTVAGEVESSKVPSYIICCDAEGMSVLTAWAADKFTAERIADTLKTCGIQDKVSHRKVIIPGYVSVLSGKLEEASGWKVLVGPREASGITNYLRSLKQ